MVVVIVNNRGEVQESGLGVGLIRSTLRRVYPIFKLRKGMGEGDGFGNWDIHIGTRVGPYSLLFPQGGVAC